MWVNDGLPILSDLMLISQMILLNSQTMIDQKSRKEDTESERPGKNVTKMMHCLPIVYRGMMPN